VYSQWKDGDFKACKIRLYFYSVPGIASLVNMTLNMRYKNDKNIKFVTRFVFFKLKMHQNPFTPLGSLRRSPRPPSWLGREIPPPHSVSPRRLGSQVPSTQIPGNANDNAASEKK